jgi:hypothetical protein
MNHIASEMPFNTSTLYFTKTPCFCYPHNAKSPSISKNKGIASKAYRAANHTKAKRANFTNREQVSCGKPHACV